MKKYEREIGERALGIFTENIQCGFWISFLLII
jgi:hypothetical protein